MMAEVDKKDSLLEQFVELRKYVEFPHGQLSKRFDQVDTRFDRMDARFNLMETRFDRVERKIDALAPARRAPRRRRKP